VIAILLSGCSTIVKGTQQQVSVATPGVQDAMCTLSSPAVGTRTVQTPGTIVLPKSKHDVAVSCVKQCYTTGVGVLASETEIMTAGIVVFGGVIGLGIDAASGAMNKYQPGVEVVMSPIPNCGPPKKGAGRAHGKHASASTRAARQVLTSSFRFQSCWAKRAQASPALS
jgi:hypothetical protein